MSAAPPATQRQGADDSRAKAGAAGPSVNRATASAPARPASAPKAAARSNPVLMLIPSSVICPGEKEAPATVTSPRTTGRDGRTGDGEGGRIYSRGPPTGRAQSASAASSRSENGVSGGSAGGDERVGTGDPALVELRRFYASAGGGGSPGGSVLAGATRGRYPNIHWLAASEEDLRREKKEKKNTHNTTHQHMPVPLRTHARICPLTRLRRVARPTPLRPSGATRASARCRPPRWWICAGRRRTASCGSTRTCGHAHTLHSRRYISLSASLSESRSALCAAVHDPAQLRCGALRRCCAAPQCAALRH